MNYFKIYLASAMFVLLPVVTFAHPGHGMGETDSLSHYLTSPLHLMVFTVLLTLAIVTVHHLARGKRKVSNNQ